MILLEFPKKTFTDFFGHQQTFLDFENLGKNGGSVATQDRWCGWWFVVWWKVSMLMWNCLEDLEDLEDLDSFKRLMLDRFGSDFEGLERNQGRKKRWTACKPTQLFLEQVEHWKFWKSHDFQNVKKLQGKISREDFPLEDGGLERPCFT